MQQHDAAPPTAGTAAPDTSGRLPWATLHGGQRHEARRVRRELRSPADPDIPHGVVNGALVGIAPTGHRRPQCAVRPEEAQR
ncbi:hypothetical protein ACIQVK_21980 [Streptomyces sp. NPDC090493]|uniref:hypothetical protein n=1 Tax=Streptomyces sp. NPDC090493 TaxID=3365964 RepID=UPI00381C623D